ncbi:MAG: hypothetical protein LBR51_04990 [Bacteroidales bacterium]|jgi:hypothetical protein|nr:hypothetical protein [Bacteroidales bacterium]
MKKIFAIALVAVFAFGLTSCNTDEKTLKEEYTEYLTGAKNGWVVSSAVSSPAMETSQGQVTDLLNGWMYNHEQDDAIIYKSTGKLEIDPGKVLPGNGETGFTTAAEVGEWTLSEDGKTLTTVIPFVNSGDATVADVTLNYMDEKTMKFTYYFKDTADDSEAAPQAKSGVEHTWSITYTKK